MYYCAYERAGGVLVSKQQLHDDQQAEAVFELGGDVN